MPKLTCAYCSRVILHVPVREAMRNYCDDKCREGWNRRTQRKQEPYLPLECFSDEQIEDEWRRSGFGML